MEARNLKITKEQTKTGYEWLELMTEEERENFMTDIVKDRGKKSAFNFLKHQKSSFKEMLMQALVWRNSEPRGHDYYNELSKKYK